jgi:hypothetical protein
MSEARIRGRPTGGPLQISEVLVAALPEEGSANKFAKLLGVAYPTLRMWVLAEDAPAVRKPNGRFILTKAVFVPWLRKNGRVSP